MPENSRRNIFSKNLRISIPVFQGQFHYKVATASNTERRKRDHRLMAAVWAVLWIINKLDLWEPFRMTH